jgi:hypothetical protein
VQAVCGVCGKSKGPHGVRIPVRRAVSSASDPIRAGGLGLAPAGGSQPPPGPIRMRPGQPDVSFGLAERQVSVCDSMMLSVRASWRAQGLGRDSVRAPRNLALGPRRAGAARPPCHSGVGHWAVGVARARAHSESGGDSAATEVSAVGGQVGCWQHAH